MNQEMVLDERAIDGQRSVVMTCDAELHIDQPLEGILDSGKFTRRRPALSITTGPANIPKHQLGQVWLETKRFMKTFHYASSKSIHPYMITNIAQQTGIQHYIFSMLRPASTSLRQIRRSVSVLTPGPS
jgi:hypothetical protein